MVSSVHPPPYSHFSLPSFSPIPPEPHFPDAEGKLQLIQGRRYGLFGRNGVGKSMLLSHISGYKFEEFPQHLRVVHIAQEADIGSDRTALQTVLESDEEKNYLESRQEELYQKMEEDPEADIEKINAEIEDLEQRLEDIGARKAESRAIQILKGLQFRPDMMQETPTRSLSGGWRMRVALACALFTTPDI